MDRSTNLQAVLLPILHILIRNTAADSVYQREIQLTENQFLQILEKNERISFK